MKLGIFILGLVSGSWLYRLFNERPSGVTKPNEPLEVVEQALHAKDLPETPIKQAFKNAVHNAH